MSEDNVFYKILMSLPESERERRFLLAYIPIRQAAKKQLALIENLKHPSIEKRGAHFWMFTMVQSFWEDIDFVFDLQRFYPKGKIHAVPTIRIAFEKLIRLGNFRRETAANQEKITEKELLKNMMRFYREELNYGGDGIIFKQYYDGYNQETGNSYPPIDKVKEIDLNPFPDSMETLINKSAIGEPDKWYHHYRFWSEAEHGGMFYQYFRTGEEGEYRRALMLLLTFSFKMLEWTDLSLGFKMQTEVQDAIKKSELIVKNGVKQSPFKRLMAKLWRLFGLQTKF